MGWVIRNWKKGGGKMVMEEEGGRYSWKKGRRVSYGRTGRGIYGRTGRGSELWKKRGLV